MHKYNFLISCTMFRFFSLDGQILTMQSRLEDEFGELVVTTSASITAVDTNSILQQAPSSVSLLDRVCELRHFLKVLLLFNSKIPDDHVSKEEFQTPSQESF